MERKKRSQYCTVRDKKTRPLYLEPFGGTILVDEIRIGFFAELFGSHIVIGLLWLLLLGLCRCGTR